MTDCPKSLPQAACDYANKLIANAASAFGVALPYDAGDVLTTVEQWRAQLAHPTDSVSTDLINSAADFWLHVGAGNIPELRKLDPKAWTIPWQYVSKQAEDWNAAAISLLLAVAANPELPPFDPLKMDWAALETGSILWSDPNVWPAVMGTVASILPAIQRFIQEGAPCGLLTGSPELIAHVWTQYAASGYNPCSISRGIASMDLPAPETPVAIQTTVDTAPTASKTSPWLAVGLFASVVAVLGVAGYAIQQQRPSQALMRNPISKQNRLKWKSVSPDEIQSAYNKKKLMIRGSGRYYTLFAEVNYMIGGKQFSPVKSFHSLEAAKNYAETIRDGWIFD